uniref:NADH-ubiquinone oxidoreductase chain 3 n=1 Tax=Mytella strigata TaxID=3245086 RepID=A0A7T5BXM7_9BIVA|nr:NADH dehydrogenase subunit 3 [Mytella strigata]QQD89969.1 NADH dehydrogenase subunit 3 [Mytella strigata]WPM98360.1 NADH dehydrogenase subunit 3 [Mytella strigata]
MVECLTLVFFLLILSAVLIFVSMILSEKSVDSREKNSPYECGFDPILSARSSFSLRFFLLAVLFVVFDVELSLLMPVVMSLNVGFNYMSVLSSFLFIFILFAGIFHEWREGSLNWVL